MSRQPSIKGKPFMPPNPRIRRWAVLFGVVALDTAIGAVLGVLLWIVWLIVDGHGIIKGLGEVEDGLSYLEGLIALGVLVGGGVGLLHGFVVMDDQEGQGPTSLPEVGQRWSDRQGTQPPSDRVQIGQESISEDASRTQT
jgi:hypothetical protein